MNNHGISTPSGGDRFSDTVFTPRSQIPPPPAIYEPTARLVYSDLGLPELFAHTASKAGMRVDLLHPEEIAAKVAEHLRSLGARAAIIPDSKMLEKIQLAAQLQEDGFEIVNSSPQTATSLSAVLVTDCFAAVAETGSLVFLQLPLPTLPPHAIVILEPKNFVADLIDLFETCRNQPRDLILLSGPQPHRIFILH